MSVKNRYLHTPKLWKSIVLLTLHIPMDCVLKVSPGLPKEPEQSGFDITNIIN